MPSVSGTGPACSGGAPNVGMCRACSWGSYILQYPWFIWHTQSKRGGLGFHRQCQRSCELLATCWRRTRGRAHVRPARARRLGTNASWAGARALRQKKGGAAGTKACVYARRADPCMWLLLICPRVLCFELWHALFHCLGPSPVQKRSSLPMAGGVSPRCRRPVQARIVVRPGPGPGQVVVAAASHEELDTQDAKMRSEKDRTGRAEFVLSTNV